MVVVTAKGFVHLAGCYEVVCRRIGSEWFVTASWGNGGGSDIYQGPDEMQARRITEKLESAAWGDIGDTERRVELRDLF